MVIANSIILPAFVLCQSLPSLPLFIHLCQYGLMGSYLISELQSVTLPSLFILIFKLFLSYHLLSTFDMSLSVQGFLVAFGIPGCCRCLISKEQIGQTVEMKSSKHRYLSVQYYRNTQSSGWGDTENPTFRHIPSLNFLGGLTLCSVYVLMTHGIFKLLTSQVHHILAIPDFIYRALQNQSTGKNSNLGMLNLIGTYFT